MIKIFCDCCGDEITQENNYSALELKAPIDIKLLKRKRVTSYNGEELLGVSEELPTVKPTVGILFNPPAVDVHICKYCLFDAINTLDDRPRCKEYIHG